MPTATATIGTIPALTQYQPGGLPLSGDERFEIVSTGSATTAASYQMLLTDIGKIPSVLPLSSPDATDLIVFYSSSQGVPYGAPIAAIGGGGSTGSGNLPLGGSTGELLYKIATASYSSSWTGVASFVGATSVLYTTGSATSILIGLATSSINSTYITPFSVGSGQINTAGVSRANIANFAVASGQIETGGVSGPNIANFAVGSTQINTSGVVRANLTTYAVGSTQVATGGIDRFNVATNAIGDAQLRTGAALSVVGNYSTAGGNVADITAAGANLFLQSSATGLFWGSVASGTLTNGGAAQLLVGVNATNAPQWRDVAGAITISTTGTTYLGTAVVTTVNISAGAVGSTQVATGGIVAANVASFTLGSAQINTGGVSQANIANFAVGSTQVNTSGISNANIANGAVNSSKIATSGVVFSNLTTVAQGAALGGWGSTVLNATVSPTLGSAGATGILALAGFSAGVVSIKPGAGTFASFNFILPTTAGSSAQALIAGVNATSPTTWTGVLTLNGTGQAFLGGVTGTTFFLGTASAGTTITFDYGKGQLQRVINGGTSTFQAPSTDGGMDVLVVNGAAAGAITFSGWSVPTLTGDTYTTTNGSTYFLTMRTASAISTYRWFATG